MPSTGSSESRLTVRRLRTACTLPANHPHPEACGARLDDAAGKDLAGSLSSILTHCLPADDPRLWFVKRLDVSLDINASWERERLASVLAARIAQELTRRLKSGSTDGGCVFFPDQASYLSRYVLDRVEGRAEGKWYYRAFGGLRLLSPSAAIRTALIDSPRSGREALRRLKPAEAARVTRVLTARDAKILVHRLAGEKGDTGEAATVFAALADAWEHAGLNPPERDDCARNALLLFITAGGPDDVHHEGASLRPAMAVSLLAHLVITISPETRRRLIRALHSDDATEIEGVVGAADAGLLAPLGRCPAHIIDGTVRMFLSAIGEAPVETSTDRGDVNEEGAPAGDSEGVVLATRFGGVFLLFPYLARLPIAEAVEGLPALADSPPAAVMRYLLLVRCLGGGHAPGAFADSLLRTLCGVKTSIPPGEMQSWTARAGGERFLSVRDAMTARRRAEGSIAVERLILKSIETDAGRLVFLLEGRRGTWIDVFEVTGSLDDEAAHVIHNIRSLGSDPTELVIDGFTEDEYESLASCVPFDVVKREGRASDATLSGRATTGDIMARLDSVGDDLDFLSFPEPWRPGRSFERILSVQAQGILRDFSWNLPGFAVSSLDYVARNFLDMPAVMEEQSARRVVRLGRPALNVILNMTGMTRKEFTLDWLDQRPFVLYQE